MGESKINDKEITTAELEGEYRVVELFIGNAKMHIQLATGALVLSVTFSRELTGQTNLTIKEMFLSLYVPWICWLIVILIGSVYRYCVSKYLQIIEWEHETLNKPRPKALFPFNHLVKSPWWLHGTLMVFFYIGTISFAVAAIIQLLGKQ